jgi:hypothetical protein
MPQIIFIVHESREDIYEVKKFQVPVYSLVFNNLVFQMLIHLNWAVLLLIVC